VIRARPPRLLPTSQEPPTASSTRNPLAPLAVTPTCCSSATSAPTLGAFKKSFDRMKIVDGTDRAARASAASCSQSSSTRITQAQDAGASTRSRRPRSLRGETIAKTRSCSASFRENTARPRGVLQLDALKTATFRARLQRSSARAVRRPAGRAVANFFATTTRLPGALDYFYRDSRRTSSCTCASARPHDQGLHAQRLRSVRSRACLRHVPVEARESTLAAASRHGPRVLRDSTAS